MKFAVVESERLKDFSLFLSKVFPITEFSDFEVIFIKAKALEGRIILDCNFTLEVGDSLYDPAHIVQVYEGIGDTEEATEWCCAVQHKSLFSALGAIKNYDVIELRFLPEKDELEFAGKKKGEEDEVIANIEAHDMSEATSFKVPDPEDKTEYPLTNGEGILYNHLGDMSIKFGDKYFAFTMKTKDMDEAEAAYKAFSEKTELEIEVEKEDEKMGVEARRGIAVEENVEQNEDTPPWNTEEEEIEESSLEESFEEEIEEVGEEDEVKDVSTEATKDTEDKPKKRSYKRRSKEEILADNIEEAKTLLKENGYTIGKEEDSTEADVKPVVDRMIELVNSISSLEIESLNPEDAVRGLAAMQHIELDLFDAIRNNVKTEEVDLSKYISLEEVKEKYVEKSTLLGLVGQA